MRSFFALKVVSVSILVLACTLLAIPNAGLAQTTEIILNDGECTVPLNDGAVVEINPGNGNVEATTFDPDFCSSTNTTAEVTVGALNPPLEAQQGSSFTVNLSSLGARECRRLGLSGTNWPSGWLSPPPDGEFNVQIPGDLSLGQKTLIYECRNGDLGAQTSAEILVTEADDGGDLFTCTDLRPSNWERDNRILVGSTAVTETWQELFGTFVSFPEGNTAVISVLRNRYAALAFDPSGAQPGQQGTVESDFAQSTGIPFGQALMSISPCPGDFRIELLGNCLQEVRITDPFEWTTSPGSSSSCVLPDSETLYFNISYGAVLPLPDGSSRVAWRCSSTTDPVPECASQIETN